MADQADEVPVVKTKEVVQAELENRKKSLEIGYVPWGVVSFEELDAAHEAMKKSWNMDTLVWQLHDLIDNIMASDTVENKQALIANLMKEFAGRTGEAMADQSAAKSTETGGFFNYLKSLLKTEEPEQNPANGMTFVKAADGTYRWVTTYLSLIHI